MISSMAAADDLDAIAGDLIDLEPSWTVPAVTPRPDGAV
jgi:hypothetical protein